MNLEIIHVGELGTNCYVTWDDQKNCVVVDCGGDARKVADYIEEHGLHPTHLLLTHGHGDHMGGAADLKDIYPHIQIVLGKKDLEMIGDGEKSMSNYVAPNARPFTPDLLVEEGDCITSGNMKFTVMETPGHTKGGVSYLKGNEIYCGDTLFQGSMGRTDLYGGDEKALFHSLAKLGALTGYYKIFPGHGSATNLDDEKLANPFLKRAIQMANASSEQTH